jgi:hypothetical protein
MSDEAKAGESYDSVGDPRTGRPPLAIDAEKVRAEAEHQATLNESGPDEGTESDRPVEPSEEMDSSDEPGGSSFLDELAEEVTGEAIDAPAMLPSVKRGY